MDAYLIYSRDVPRPVRSHDADFHTGDRATSIGI